jgi:hypothetical protein
MELGLREVWRVFGYQVGAPFVPRRYIHTNASMCGFLNLFDLLYHLIEEIDLRTYFLLHVLID